MAESFWLSEPAEPLARSHGARRPDVAVIGAGVTGCSCALTLAEGGLRSRPRGETGRLVREAVLGRRKPELDLFDPARLLR